jgi:hypothetical protein
VLRALHPFIRALLRLLGWPWPQPGWISRVRLYRSGSVIWLRPSGKQLVGFPLEWCLAEEQPDGTIVFAPDSDKRVKCARCGIVVHVLDAGMSDSLSIPSCVDCRDRVEGA